jgi:uncharacterized delta-60 repeat protein
MKFLRTIFLLCLAPWIELRAQHAGSIDSGFSCSVTNGGLGSINSIAIQSDGKILIGGEFSSVNGQQRSCIARLMTNGELDSGFQVGSGFDGEVFGLGLQQDGKVVAVGAFTNYDGNPAVKIVRLNTNGLLDSTFSAPVGSLTPTLRTVAVLPDGKIVVGGNDPWGIHKLTTTGADDPEFTPVHFFSGETDCLVVDSFGRIVIGGSYYDGGALFCVARVNANGGLDSSFSRGIATSRVYGIAIQRDQRLIVVGDFSKVEGVSQSAITRLSADGHRDPSFDASTLPFVGIIRCVALDENDSILIGGDFQISSGLARLRKNGALDRGFIRTEGPGWGVYSLTIDANQKLLMSGGRTITRGTNIQGIARLNTGQSFRQWQRENFTPVQVANPEVSDLGADPENDGAVNLIEYAIGSNPNLSDSIKPTTGVVSLQDSGVTNSYLTLTLTTLRTARDATVLIDASTDLVIWTNVATAVGAAFFSGPGVLDQTTNENRTLRVRHLAPNVAGSNRFLRVNVSNP